MGIRYYAYPIAADLVEAARKDPWEHLSADPLADAWQLHAPDEPVPPRPTMLYLDKCWSLLQQLTRPAWGTTPRPCHALVRGDVTMTDRGWIPYVQVLDPDEVAVIAADLAELDANDVVAMLQDHPGRADDLDYVIQYLTEAQRFTALMADRGQGLVTMIG